MLKINPVGKNQTEIKTDSMTIFFSYKTPVACFIEGQGYFKTTEKHSVTTSKHVNKWLDGAEAKIKDQSFFNNLIA